jgi:hypothetical protein
MKSLNEEPYEKQGAGPDTPALPAGVSIRAR